MNKRNNKGQYAGRLSIKKMSASWFASVASLGLLYVAGQGVMATFGSLRSCNANASGMVMRSCGKQGFAGTDFIILGLFVASALMFVSFFTAAWRITTRKVV